MPVEEAPSWPGPAPPTPKMAAALAETTVKGPGIVPGSVWLQTLPDAYVRWTRSNMRRPGAGYVYVTARLPLGDFVQQQARVLADLAEAYGDGTVRLSIDQNVIFRWVPADRPGFDRLAAAGSPTPDAGTIADVTSCPGAETCRLAVTQSRGLGRLLIEHLNAHPELVDAVPSGDIKISGCPNGCGQHHISGIGFGGVCGSLAAGPCRNTSCW